MTGDALGQMAGHGAYDHHSLAQHSAGSFGIPMILRAVDEMAPVLAGDAPLLVADLGAAGGRNELEPMRAVIERIRARGSRAPVVVVHTDIPSNDFTTLFETIEQSPQTYLSLPDVFAFAAGRSFFERIFPADAVTFGWSAIAVHWLSRVPEPVADHIYCEFAAGDARAALAGQSARDWTAFVTARAAELRPGGQLVVVGGAATDDGASGAGNLMTALNDAFRDHVASGGLTAAEWRKMTVPTWNRTMAEFTAPFADEGAATAAGLQLVEHDLAQVPDAYMAAYRETHDAAAFAASVAGFVRAFTEPSLIGVLDRPANERTAVADAVYANLRRRLAADPESFETIWRVALLRIRRAPA